ncbi:ThiF family adenylyltransferase [Sphingosinicella sp.]|uniref:ThiF family adenylyltransferase n=1 Tax=Sphingosinicella sp. TaxID=1917971 RepID=UPI001796930E|nr:ThiF family adenylyltransferase [Sphingosinicella sp.]MBA4758996.1 ThiF family adenylyltransferase [Sphingosinicella sp.]
MTQYSATLQQRHLERLKALLLRDDGKERAAYVFFSSADIQRDPWDRESHEKFLSANVREIPFEDIVSADSIHVSWLTDSYVKALRDAEANNHTVAIVHSHPKGFPAFSQQDDENEQDLAQLAVNRNGPGTKLISLVLADENELFGRVWLEPSKRGWEKLRMIKVWGNDLHFWFSGSEAVQSSKILTRQALAFGNALNGDLKRMRIGVVGCGGTGSALAMLLARLGVGQIALFDNDIVETSNLNRLHGASQCDADAMKPKVRVVADHIAQMGLGVRAVPFEGWVGDKTNRDALRACDAIFGCTDDHEGRMFLSRFAYYYLVPVMDMGLAIDVSDSDPPEIESMDGRVTVLGPENPCLVCAGLVDPEIARAEALKREHPDEYEKLKREAYVLGEGNSAPAVVTFTTEVACMAVNELIQRMTGFRAVEGSAANRVRKFHLCEDRRPGYRPRTGCRICDDDGLWGRGDVDPFIGRVS